MRGKRPRGIMWVRFKHVLIEKLRLPVKFFVIDQGAVNKGWEGNAAQGLRSPNPDTNDLALTLSTLGQQFAGEHINHNSPVFLIVVEGKPKELHPILRDEAYRIASEALRNAFLHAHAKRIEVEIHYDKRKLRLRVRDDGRGIDSQFATDKGRPGHWGLRGMHERAKLLGGSLKVWSKAESGTEVELTIPASTAYVRSATQRRSWFSRKGNAVN